MMSVPFHRIEVSATEIEEVVSVLRSGWLTTGPRVRALEEWLAQRDQAHVVATVSCTHAIEGALHAAGIGPGDEVVTSALTFTATTAAIVRAGGTPRWVDVDRRTGNITPETIEGGLTAGTKAVLTVDYGGRPVDYSAVARICAERGIPFLSDAAHSFGATVDGRPIASIADATCYSFYATKNITGGEGGAVCTPHDEWADMLRRWRLHGLSSGAEDRYREGEATYDVTMLGSKANMSDLTAALVLAQGRREVELRSRREAVAARYLADLADLAGIELPSPAPGHTWHLFPVRVPPRARPEFIGELTHRGVATSIHFRPLHQMTYWRQTLGPPPPLPETERWGASVLSLPIFPAMRTDEVEHVVDAVTDVAAKVLPSH
jgi:dTDP-4-amino-4,6-dideoxygalactose transaminase